MSVLNEQVPNTSDAPGVFDAASSFQTGVMPLEYRQYFSIQATITGSPVGVLSLQGSNDFGRENAPFNPSVVANWTEITGSSAAVSGAGSVMWNYQNCGFKWVRLVYVATSGTGSIVARFNSKGNV